MSDTDCTPGREPCSVAASLFVFFIGLPLIAPQASQEFLSRGPKIQGFGWIWDRQPPWQNQWIYTITTITVGRRWWSRPQDPHPLPTLNGAQPCRQSDAKTMITSLLPGYVYRPLPKLTDWTIAWMWKPFSAVLGITKLCTVMCTHLWAVLRVNCWFTLVLGLVCFLYVSLTVLVNAIVFCCLFC